MKYSTYLAHLPRLDGKTIVVTGANSGIGLQTAKHLAWLGAEVILACRSEERAAAAMTYIYTQVPEARLEFADYDQAAFASVEAFAENCSGRKLDAVVFNAGICGARADLQTQEGFPLIFGTNFVGAAYLTELLHDKFASEHTRLVYVSSLAGYGAKKQPLLSFHSGTANRQYGYSKLCIGQYACDLIEEGMEAVVVHPGASGTAILFGKDSGCPAWIVKIGRKALDHFHDKGAKASLVNVQAVCSEYRPYLYLHPRCLGSTVGLPTVSKMPEKFRRGGIREDTRAIIQQRNRSGII